MEPSFAGRPSRTNEEPPSVGREDVGPASILLLAPVSRQPALGTIRQLEHEYSLKDELDPEWAVRPLDLSIQLQAKSG